MIDAVAEIIRRLDRHLEEYRQVVMAERDRIMRDLHDDVGGRLLTLVHQCENRKAGSVAREALRDRLEQQGVKLEWDREIEEKCVYPMSAMDILNIARILHEAISNAQKHAAPKSIQVVGQMRGSELTVTIANDIPDTDKETDGIGQFGGKGIANMKRRAVEMGGRLSVEKASSRYVIELKVSVRHEPSGEYNAQCIDR